MKKILTVLILFLTSCGYQPIYVSQKLDNIEFSKITLDGDLGINRKIIKSLSIKETKSKLLANELVLKSSYEMEETSKNSKGQTTSYRSTVMVDLIIENNSLIIKNKNFIKTFDYNKTDNKFDLVKYQIEIKNNMINKIIEEMVIYISLE